MNISVCILTKDEVSIITPLIKSMRPHMEDILVVDDNSTDLTVHLARDAGARVISLPFKVEDKGFGEARTFMTNQATKDWVLHIDADELISDNEIHILDTLMRYPDKLAWSLPRRKWLDYKANIRDEYEAYPDWQPRFYKKNIDSRWQGLIHERLIGHTVYNAYRGPHIEHLQHECRSSKKLAQRNDTYNKLAPIEGVKIHGGRLLTMEEIANAAV
jgi:glycosyltransferase involved in cell wall biosynthesis